jgi:glutamate racemase
MSRTAHATQPIGIFDSGIGGLTVAKAIHDLLPNERLVYVGDTLHMPYGDKSAKEIQGYCNNIVEFFLEKKVKLIVIACNTASSLAASFLREKFWRRVEIMGVIRPVVQLIVSRKYENIGIIGTTGTIQSGIFPTLYQEYHGTGQLHLRATPKLAPLIEAGLQQTVAMKESLHAYLHTPEFERCDSIVLACTHYPLIKQQVIDFFDGKKEIIDNAIPMAHAVKRYLDQHQLLNTSTPSPNEFFVTKMHESFEQHAALFFGHHLPLVEIKIHPL